MSVRPVEEGSAWYLNFWPWFIVGLLGVSVVASLATVVIAYRHRDVDVRASVAPGSAPAVERGAGTVAD